MSVLWRGAGWRAVHARRLGWAIPLVFVVVLGIGAPGFAAPGAEPLTLGEALALALERNPGLAAQSWDVRASEAAAFQAGLRPNPTLQFDIENIAGEGDRNGADVSETTLAISQLLELGGKRVKRRALGDAQAKIATWQYEAARLEVVAGTTTAFLDALAQQRAVALERDQIESATELLQGLNEQVGAGDLHEAEELRAQVEVTKREIELQLRRRALRAAYVRLATAWGDSEPAFDVVEGDLESVGSLPAEGDLLARLQASPQLERWQAEVTARRAAVALEDARRIPSVSLGLGPRHFNETDDWALVVGVQMPIPLFDRNQGARRASRHRLEGARERRRATELRLRRALARAYQRLGSAVDEITALRTRAIPTAERVYGALQGEGGRGVDHVVEILDAQRTLFGLRTQLVAALAAYHAARAETEAILGGPLDDAT